ncbi:SDR family NAD(P)-dependent oxidoreductase [Methylopila sp. Yamaguchi]|uniref:SDR family NAD(P)-dependent oxidoreductase n=1 Tax=Methylopila sp. Yamaguchi TaxID=1437817 RepID=UPI000CBCE270|nr:SDR family NAD(P)-dependent oxidoreductase [Methylopila sp. Yamaguchi]GBD46792.1 short-chain dehydrogenase [Methylopila sp. Yamaguchi]
MALRSRRRWCSVVITGAGAGLGRELALGYAAQGCIVFGTAASSAEVQELRTASGGRVSLAVSDVTKFTKGRIWAEGVSEALDGAGLDLLINRSHVIPPSPLEAVPIDTARYVFEQNVLGAMSIINAFLPALRRSRGRILQIVDAMASTPVPFSGLAGATNAALDALLSAYRADLKPHSVHITTALMGRVQGSDASKTSALISAAEDMTPEQRELYGRQLATYAKRIGVPAADLLDARGAAALLIEILERDPAPSRVAVGADAEAVLKAIQHLSDDELDDMRLEPTATS